MAARITPKTTAIVVTHLWGIPADLEGLSALADKHGLALLEDGSHAHGATIGRQKVGTFGHSTAFSMNGPKPLSAGEGGFVLTDDDEIFYRVLLHGHYHKRCRYEIPASHTLKLPVWHREEGMTLVNQYIEGFRKVVENHHELLG
ncbi:MAG: DegT/DnrJ/EryC1/StrS family aminotransferase [Pseudonocardiaceae bacterium]